MPPASNLIEVPVHGVHAAHEALSRDLLEAIAPAGDAATGMGRVVDRVRREARAGGVEWWGADEQRGDQT
jgi:hypothetical protein